MTVSASPALVVRVSLRQPDDVVVERVRCCWRAPPRAAEVLRELATRAVAARRRGLHLVVDDAPDDVLRLLRVAGLS